MMRYRYLGDAMTAVELRGQECDPVRRADGKCICGGSKMLVRFADGTEHVVLRRRLRLMPGAVRIAPRRRRSSAQLP